MNKEASKANIRKAQDARRLIGVEKFLKKLEEYREDPELWEDIERKFGEHGWKIERGNWE